MKRKAHAQHNPTLKTGNLITSQNQTLTLSQYSPESQHVYQIYAKLLWNNI